MTYWMRYNHLTMHIITRGCLLEFVSVPHTREEYERAIVMLDELIDEVGEAEDHPLASLMETLGSLIEAYEDDHLPEPMGDPATTLHILMEEHGLRNTDLPEIGDPATIEAILQGRSELTQSQLYALGKRFHVSPSVFL
jgi:HTH-type transcriptional regulator / antitoxin HigA